MTNDAESSSLKGVGSSSSGGDWSVLLLGWAAYVSGDGRLVKGPGLSRSYVINRGFPVRSKRVPRRRAMRAGRLGREKIGIRLACPSDNWSRPSTIPVSLRPRRSELCYAD